MPRGRNLAPPFEASHLFEGEGRQLKKKEIPNWLTGGQTR
jgi:hypothetical protein